MPPHGWPLFEERDHPLGLVRGVEQRLEAVALESQPLVERQLLRGVDGGLRGANGFDGEGRDRRGAIQRGVDDVGRGHDHRHEPEPFGLLRADLSPGEHDVHRPRATDDARQPLRPACPRDDPFGVVDRVGRLRTPVIAAVRGYALGGGCELALACDYRIAGERAVFGQPEILLGVIPGGGGTQRLARLVGPSRAKELCITGRQVKADEALRIGLADEVVPNDELHARAMALAAECARGPVLAQAYAKQAIDRGLSAPLADGLRIEQDLFVEAFRTNDSQIGVKSFLEHGPGKAQFTGR